MKKIRLSTLLWCLLVAFAYGVGVWRVSRTYRDLPDYRTDMGGSVDTGVIMPGLYAAPHFRDTLKWWTGSWVAGDRMVYYRPLTSLAWWCEWKLFGANGIRGFMTVSWVLFGMVTVVALAFFSRMFELPLAATAMAIWVSCQAEQYSLPSPFWAPWHWKNDPELWTSLGIIGCLHFLLSYWRTGRGRYVSLACLCMLIGICFKELGYVTFFMALALWFFERRRDAQKTPVWPVFVLFALSVVFFIYRTVVIGRTTPANSNGSWWERAAINLFAGRAAATMTLGEYVPFAVACTVFAAIMLWRRRFWATGALIAVAAVCVWINDASAEFPFDAALKLMSVFPLSKAVIWMDSIYTTLMMALWWDFFSKRDEARLFGICWYTLAYLPMLTAPIWQHSLCLPSMGWGLWLAVPLLAVARSLEAKARAWWTKLQNNTGGTNPGAGYAS